MFIRANKRKGRVYYYIVKSIREGNRVQQKVIAYLGTAKTLLKKLGHSV